MLLHEAVDFHARGRGDACFSIFEGTELSYAQASRRAGHIAAALTGMGLKKGQRIAVLAENSPDVLLVFLAASRAGLVVVPLNYRLSPAEWDKLIADSEAAAVIADAVFCERLETGVPGSPDRRIVLQGKHDGWVSIGDLVAGAPASMPARDDLDKDDIVFQMYTSGTTGRSKGALISHRNIVTSIHHSLLSMSCKLNPGDRTLVVLPLFHIAAINTALSAASSGATLVIHRNVDPGKVLESLASEEIVSVSLVPAVIQFLLTLPGIDGVKFPHLRSIGYGASPIAAPVLRRAMEVFECDFMQGYGMTELAGSCSILTEADHRRALKDRPDLLLSAGKVLPGVRLRIVDPDGNDAAIGEVGEIVVQSEQVMAGYWNMPEATAEANRDGWFHTGDAASMDAEGFIYIRDRMKDMIVSGAENIYPAEIEAVLYQHPDVAEVAVIGVPDDRWGETVMAVIVRKPGARAQEADLDAFCRANLGGFKVPRRYTFAENLPRNATGKILKRELRAEYWDGQERFVS